MANHMAEVAALLDLELREEFRIEKCQGLFRFTEDGLQRLLDSSSSWTFAEHSILRELLNGKVTVDKFPWKPRKGEMYYFPDMGTSSLGSCLCWLGTETDKNLYDRGFVFQTIEEAIATAKRILTIVQEGKNNG